ncbi:MAG: phosphomethylpyrimidine kinase [Methanoregula sp.]|jgi:hydroxymethylpyrimidine/phosphomethylpyrimidine kinase|nr:phosphomethylpyrimidine kinase [Methanoregula sp.]
MDPARERAFVISSLDAARELLLKTPVSARLIPPEGVSFGFALKGARDSSGVAAVRIGIRNDRAACTCTFGTDEPVVRAILTVMKFNPVIRSAAVLQFSDRALSVFEHDLFLECASFTAAPAGRGTGTMDWGIAFCCKCDVPDVIYEKNPDKTQSRLVISGEDPADVVNNIIICSGRI